MHRKVLVQNAVTARISEENAMAEDVMPTVNAEFGAKPVIEFPATDAPKGLKVVELVEGNGTLVRAGDTVTVDYYGAVWGSDTPFDSSYDRGTPAQFAIGVGQVIKGWDLAIVGRSRRSRLLISIPSDYGYGSRGIPQAGIKGGDTLVFVVDIH